MHIVSDTPLSSRHGFTLVELSIVLVILGLLVGGVLTGQSLIRAAELRSISTQYNNFVTATNTFRDKYFSIPGDMTNATAYWGEAASGASCITTQGTGTQTCNGNGDGKILNSTNSGELFRFWQQLANAGLIEGNYTGVQDGSTVWSATSKNSPVGKISSTLWWIWSYGSLTNDSNLFNGNYDNILLLGRVQANNGPGDAFLKPEEVYNVDMKIDDGKPGTGRMKVFGWSNCTTATDGTQLSATYNLSNSTLACTPIFVPGF